MIKESKQILDYLKLNNPEITIVRDTLMKNGKCCWIFCPELNKTMVHTINLGIIHSTNIGTAKIYKHRDEVYVKSMQLILSSLKSGNFKLL